MPPAGASGAGAGFGALAAPETAAAALLVSAGEPGRAPSPVRRTVSSWSVIPAPACIVVQQGASGSALLSPLLSSAPRGRPFSPGPHNAPQTAQFQPGVWKWHRRGLVPSCRSSPVI